MFISTEQLRYDFHDFGDLVQRSLQAQLMERCGRIGYYSRHSGLLRSSAADLQRRLANLPWAPYRITASETVFCARDAVVAVDAVAKDSHTRLDEQIWASNEEAGMAVLSELRAAIGEELTVPAELSIKWAHRGGRGMDLSRFDDEVGETVHPSAYPWLPGGLAEFTSRFLASREAVSVFFGAPGVGKTRLLRHLLASLGTKKGRPAQILYTTDLALTQTDELFIYFVRGDYDALVIEDADHLLRPRSDGNTSLHRFLAVSDGFVQATGRKVLFSTNLPSRLAIDEALLRPGRCFCSVQGMRLTPEQARDMVRTLCPQDELVAAVLGEPEFKLQSTSLSEVYAAVDRITHLTHGPQLQAPA